MKHKNYKELSGYREDEFVLFFPRDRDFYSHELVNEYNYVIGKFAEKRNLEKIRMKELYYRSLFRQEEYYDLTIPRTQAVWVKDTIPINEEFLPIKLRDKLTKKSILEALGY